MPIAHNTTDVFLSFTTSSSYTSYHESKDRNYTVYMLYALLFCILVIVGTYNKGDNFLVSLNKINIFPTKIKHFITNFSL